MVFAKDYVGHWGIYPAMVAFGNGLVHPDDLDKVRKLTPGLRVFYCHSSQGNFLTLQYGNETYRVKPDNFTIVPSPSHSFGDTVKIMRSSGKTQDAIVEHIIWHSKKNTHYYLMAVEGKLLSRWFFEEDCQPL